MLRRAEAAGGRLPSFPERYVGRYRNKVAHVVALRARQFNFFTLLRHFFVHVPHASAAQDEFAAEHVALKTAMFSAFDEDVAALRAQPFEPPPATPADEGVLCTYASSAR